MKCTESERLIDAYLDGELSDSLRLEFDTHRLRCRRCQLTLAMMESVEHVVASERGAPVLSDDFGDRVMAAIERRRPLSVRLRPTRVAVVAGALLQAAAVIYLAVLLPSQRNVPSTEAGAGRSARTDLRNDARFAAADAKVERHEALHDEILARVEAARANLASEVNQLARYPLALSVSDDFARASAGMEGSNPWHIFLRALVPVEPEEVEPLPPAATDRYSL